MNIIVMGLEVTLVLNRCHWPSKSYQKNYKLSKLRKKGEVFSFGVY